GAAGALGGSRKPTRCNGGFLIGGALHDDGVLQRDLRQHVADGVLSQLLEVIRSGPAAQDDPRGPNFNVQLPNPPAAAGPDTPLQTVLHARRVLHHDFPRLPRSPGAVPKPWAAVQALCVIPATM